MTTRTALASLEFYRVTVTPSPDEDPTSLPVKMAFPTTGQPPSTFVNANWELGGPPYVAAILIGPDDQGSDLELPVGTYDVYVQIEDTNETPAFLADRLVIFDVAFPLLASVSDLADQLGTSIDPEDPASIAALQFASDYVRTMTGQFFSLVTDDEVELVGNWSNELKLPQKPVVDVTEVSIRRYYDSGFSTYTPAEPVTPRGLLLNPDGWGGPRAAVRVTYSHGYVLIPPTVVGLVCAIAGRRRTTIGGVQSEQIGSYSYSVATGADGTPVDLTNLEQQVLRNLRRAAAA
jgi:hypothetical protein